jgi:2',3'-cyclic-nucleotide 2'-phosphodiesterase (5'-nucleotidase family)
MQRWLIIALMVAAAMAPPGAAVGDLARALTGADVALFNAGTFRASIPAGSVRIRDIHEALPAATAMPNSRSCRTPRPPEP